MRGDFPLRGEMSPKATKGAGASKAMSRSDRWDGLRLGDTFALVPLRSKYKIQGGYFMNSKQETFSHINENGEAVPAPLVANVFEYGRSGEPFPKQPFIRKSFKKSAIQKAMEKEQKKYLPED